VKGTGAEKVFVTHGFQSTFSRYLNESGIQAAEVKTEYGTEEDEENLPPGTEEGNEKKEND
jgi:putative mRNA 3-end processing factor